MDWSQSLNARPFFDRGNYAFWKVQMRAFLCAIDESVWDSVVNGYIKPTTAKSEWDKVALNKLNLGEKIEDSKVVRKILRSLSESFRANVTAIEESKDLDEIKIQELIRSLQTYELGLPSHRKNGQLLRRG